MIKVNNDLERLEDALGGGGGEVEIVPIFVPMYTYRILLEEGQKRGLSVADVLRNAVINYLKPAEVKPILQQEPVIPARAPDITYKRKK